jgi:tRNA (mo5U34)-methyltransferase
MDPIQRLAPWMYEFELPGGVKTPLLHESLRAVHAARRSMIFETLDAVGFDRTASVLDLGCSEGYFSFEFAKRGAREVLGIDARGRNIEKAELVRDLLGLGTCRFEIGDVTELELAPGSFDVTLLLGLIYHVEDPIRLVRRAAKAARRLLVLETQLTKPHAPIAYGWGTTEAWYTADFWAMKHEDPATDDLSSTRGFSLIPSATAVVSLLREIGFASVVQLHPNARTVDEQYVNVDRAVFLGWW